MLFGKTPEEAEASMMPAVLGDGFGQSIRMIGHALGFALDPDLSVSHEVAVAPPRSTPLSAHHARPHRRPEVPMGGHGARRAGRHGGHQWFMGEEHLEPAWGFGPEGERFEVEVSGDPPARVTFRGWHPDSNRRRTGRNPGVVATATTA